MAHDLDLVDVVEREVGEVVIGAGKAGGLAPAIDGDEGLAAVEAVGEDGGLRAGRAAGDDGEAGHGLEGVGHQGVVVVLEIVVGEHGGGGGRGVEGLRVARGRGDVNGRKLLHAGFGGGRI
jgi:hypothetical protein